MKKCDILNYGDLKQCEAVETVQRSRGAAFRRTHTRIYSNTRTHTIAGTVLKLRKRRETKRVNDKYLWRAQLRQHVCSPWLFSIDASFGARANQLRLCISIFLSLFFAGINIFQFLRYVLRDNFYFFHRFDLVSLTFDSSRFIAIRYIKN